MKFLAGAAALISLVPSILALTINTPMNVVQCQPILLTWADGQGPYFLSAIPGGQTSAAPIQTFPTQSGNSYTWIVDLPVGTNINFQLKDQTGETVYTDIVNIKGGSETGCLSSGGASATGTPAAGQTSGNTPGASGTSGAPGASGAPAATATGSAKPSASGPAGSRPAGGSGTATATGATPSTTNAGTRVSIGTYGLAGFVGLVGLAVF